jgi:lysozyme
MDARKRRIAAATALATALAIPAEGLRQFAYRDPPGILTVCYGHTGSDVVAGRKYSLAECNQFLTDDMRTAIDIVERCAPGLPEKPLAAFADATFNIGSRLVCDMKNSTAARLLKAGDIAGACRQLPRWNRATVAGQSVVLPGLTKRRQAEMELCLS